MIVPTARAPITAPTKAPTIPCQKRSGRKTVKCQRAMPIVTKTRKAISRIPRSSPSAAFAPLRSFRPSFLVPFAPLGRLRVGVAAGSRRLVGCLGGTRCLAGLLRLGSDHVLRHAAVLGRLGGRHGASAESAPALGPGCLGDRRFRLDLRGDLRFGLTVVG